MPGIDASRGGAMTQVDNGCSYLCVLRCQVMWFCEESAFKTQGMLVWACAPMNITDEGGILTRQELVVAATCWEADALMAKVGVLAGICHAYRPGPAWLITTVTNGVRLCDFVLFQVKSSPSQ